MQHTTPRAASVGYARLPSQVAHDLALACPQLWLLPTAQVVDGRLVWRPPPATQDTPEPAARHLGTHTADPVAAPTARASRRLKLVQANVQTMSDVEPSFFNRSGHGQRRIYLSRQLHDLGVHIAFLQECRSRIGRWASHGYLSWRGGHSKGCYGVEIWVDPGCIVPPPPARRLENLYITTAAPSDPLPQGRLAPDSRVCACPACGTSFGRNPHLLAPAPRNSSGSSAVMVL